MKDKVLSFPNCNVRTLEILWRHTGIVVTPEKQTKLSINSENMFVARIPLDLLLSLFPIHWLTFFADLSTN